MKTNLQVEYAHMERIYLYTLKAIRTQEQSCHPGLKNYFVKIY